MNFLAHLYLSGNDDGILVGNFIADGIRGKDLDHYPNSIKEGIILHRKIDFYTDNHPIVKQTVKKLRDTSGKYAPVVSDIVYDHFLAHNWNSYSAVPLAQFAQEKYAVLRHHKQHIPERMRFALASMIRQNWLVRYADLEGIAKTLRSMSKRVHFANNMASAIKDLEGHYADFQQEFDEFFPQLEEYVSKQVLNLTALS